VNADAEQRLIALETRTAKLVVDLAEAIEQSKKLENERDEYRKLNLLLREENERLKRGLLGQKAERLPRNDQQLSLAILGMAMSSNAQGSETPAESLIVAEKVAAHLRRRPIRKPLPDEFLRIRIEMIPDEVEREGRDNFTQIGVETREVLERRSASTVVVQMVYPKFVRKERETPGVTKVVMASAVELPIQRGSAGPSMLSDSIVRRFQDHQPANRLEGIYGREGLPVARSTICSWHEQVAALVRPLVEAMFIDALGLPYLCVDATGVLVLAKDKCRNGHFWVLVAPGRHILYRFSKRHDGNAVDGLLRDYKGFLVADAHAVYDHLYRTGDVVEVGCWAHCRRYFFKALESDPERAKIALSHIGALFRIERSIADSPRNERERTRSAKSRSIVDAFFAWCDSQVDRVLDESPMATALGYARNQRQALLRFLDDGRLPIHNNASELALRRQVVGRRNWLFVGSDEGGETNATLVSLLASCRLHEIEPLAYIRDLLCLIPSWPRNRVLELAPVNWKKTLEQPETQKALAANIFRRVVLELS
jgi:transposase